MIKVMITDTHHGWRQNSTTWLSSQMAFLDKSFIPYLKNIKSTGEHVRLIHLGDVFDSRSSISPMVAKMVRDRYIEMAGIVDDFYIVGGNHDFYSPISDEIESLTMVFRDCGIILVTDNIIYADDDMFVPWYEYKKDFIIPTGIRNIYTHADIFGEDKKIISGVRIFSGHIHSPQIDEEQEMYNMGSCYPLTFSDANQDRFFYTLADDVVSRIPNKNSIRFWRIINENIFKQMHGINDYYELYVDQRNMQNPLYQTRCQELTKRYKNICVIPIINVNESIDESFSSYDINEICRNIIPPHLINKFNMVAAGTPKE